MQFLSYIKLLFSHPFINLQKKPELITLKSFDSENFAYNPPSLEKIKAQSSLAKRLSSIHSISNNLCTFISAALILVTAFLDKGKYFYTCTALAIFFTFVGSVFSWTRMSEKYDSAHQELEELQDTIECAETVSNVQLIRYRRICEAVDLN